MPMLKMEGGLYVNRIERSNKRIEGATRIPPRSSLTSKEKEGDWTKLER